MYEKRIQRLADLILVFFTVLSLRIVYWQFFRAAELAPLSVSPILTGGELIGFDQEELDRRVLELLSSGGVDIDFSGVPQPLVQRTRQLLDTITRGTIYDRSGQVLAYDGYPPPADGEAPQRSRIYANPVLAPVTGYTSGLRLGVSGVEYSHNAFLLGLHRFDTQIDRLFKAPIQGSDLILTVDSGLQHAAVQALQGQRGAVVIMDGHSGAVLAMVSAPYVDPNRMNDAAYIESLDLSCTGSDCPAPLLNRAAQALFVPGSTWKTIPLIAGLDTGQLTPGMIFDFGRPRQGPNGPYYVYAVDGGEIPDPNHTEARLTLELSYARSANAAFARIGDEMGAPTLLEYAHRLGFGPQAEFNFEVPQARTQVASDETALAENNLLRAATAIGQGELLVTPLSMARVALAVVNNGDLPLPYLVEAIRDPNGRVRPGLIKGGLRRGLMKPETAREVKRIMRIAVEQGSGNRAAVPGLTVGGKTGTAQLGNNRPPHAWFMGYAEEGENAVVMVVLIENGGEGSQAAAPVFARLAQPALRAARGEVQTPPLPAPLPSPTPQPEINVSPQPTAAVVEEQEPEPTALVENIPVPMAPDISYHPDARPFFEKVRASCPERAEGAVGSGEFGFPSTYQFLSGGSFRAGHPGLDFGAPIGSPVYAADGGEVIFAGWTSAGYGNAVVIDHGNGFWTLYAHLSQVSTRCGVAIRKGERIGMSGNTGNSTGPHLHFEVRVATGYVDPIEVLPTP